MNVKLLPWIILGVIALIGVAGWRGYSMGYSAAETAHKVELLARIEAGEKLDQARIKAARERDELARQLEEQAYAEPVTVDRCLSPSRVQRLNSIKH
jgi:hypothetical protein